MKFASVSWLAVLLSAFTLFAVGSRVVRRTFPKPLMG
jgi:hypothetical protein